MTDRPSSTLRGSVLVALALGVMNAGAYALTMIAARVLGPEEYSQLAAVMGLLFITNVVALALQATAARRASVNPTDRVEHEVLPTSYRLAAGLGVLLLVGAPATRAALDLDSWVTPVMLALGTCALTVSGAQLGLLQGELRWVPLSLMYAASGLGRVGLGAAALVLLPHTAGGMIGVAASTVLPLVVGAWALRRHRDRSHEGEHEPQDDEIAASLVEVGEPEPATAPTTADRPQGILGELVHSSHALLAFFVLSNIDVVLARMALSKHEAGLYAAGQILAKAALFLPQFVVVVAFPAMARDSGNLRLHARALAAVAAVGGVVTAGVAVLSPIALELVGGRGYAPIQGSLWAFTLLGTALAMVQLLVYGALAQRHEHLVYLVWFATLGTVGFGVHSHSAAGLLTLVVTVDLVLLLGLVAVMLVVPSVRRRASSVPLPR